MTRIQPRRCEAARGIRYCLALASASLLGLIVGVSCGLEQAEPAKGARPERPIEASYPTLDARIAERPVIVFLGTSLTTGLGLEEDQAFPALIQEMIESAGFEYRVVNAGVSGDTSAGGLRRLDWLLRLPVAVLVLEIGANDMLRGQSVKALEHNLDAILERTAKTHPQAKFLIAGMRAAPNLGPEYRSAFDAVYPSLASRHGMCLIPFLLEDVAARRSLNQADGIHPTAEGHALIAMRVWKELELILRAN